MKIALIILAVLAVMIIILTIYLLVVPIRLVIDTRKGVGRIGWNSWLSAKLKRVKDFEFILHLPFWQKRFNLLTLMSETVLDKRPSKKKNLPQRGRSSKQWLKVLKALSVTEVKVDLDTDDFILNAYLVPVFSCLQAWTGYSLKINFKSRRELKIVGETRMIDLLLRA